MVKQDRRLSVVVGKQGMSCVAQRVVRGSRVLGALAAGSAWFVVVGVFAACQPSPSDSDVSRLRAGAVSTGEVASGGEDASGAKDLNLSASRCLLGASDAARIEASLAQEQAYPAPESSLEKADAETLERVLRPLLKATPEACPSTLLGDFEKALPALANGPSRNGDTQPSLSLSENVFHGTMSTGSGIAHYGYINGIGRIVISSGGASRAYTLNDFSPDLFVKAVRFLLRNS